MENLTSKILELANDKKYYVIRQAAYKGNAYYFVVRVSEDEEDFSDEFKFLTKVEKEDGNFVVKEVTDEAILKILSKNIKIEAE